jgi:hypothetical protein
MIDWSFWRIEQWLNAAPAMENKCAGGCSPLFMAAANAFEVFLIFASFPARAGCTTTYNEQY